MRKTILTLAVATSVLGLYGCQGTSDPNNRAIMALQNVPNSCGAGGTANDSDCKSNSRGSNFHGGGMFSSSPGVSYR